MWNLFFNPARDKVAGTDWSIVTTSDGKKYYYDNKQKVKS
jgi:transcription elongation regulator 1